MFTLWLCSEHFQYCKDKEFKRQKQKQKKEIQHKNIPQNQKKDNSKEPSKSCKC